jgi:hypothetical protein
LPSSTAADAKEAEKREQSNTPNIVQLSLIIYQHEQLIKIDHPSVRMQSHFQELNLLSSWVIFITFILLNFTFNVVLAQQ